MGSTYAAVIIEAEYQQQAQTDLGDGHFIVPCSADGNEPVTFYADGGWWYNSELDFIVNDATWPKQVFFGADLQSVLTDLGLTIVIVPEPEPIDEEPSVEEEV